MGRNSNYWAAMITERSPITGLRFEDVLSQTILPAPRKAANKSDRKISIPDRKTEGPSLANKTWSCAGSMGSLS